MFSDKGRGIPTTVFSISDFHYSKEDHIKLPNRKGLLLTDEGNNVIRPKEAYYAVRNLATLWDEADTPVDDFTVTVLSSLHHSLWRFRDSETGFNSFVLWHDAGVPGNSARFIYEDVEVFQGAFAEPVAVDVRTGKVYRLEMDGTLLRRVPVYDSPVFVIERELLKIR